MSDPSYLEKNCPYFISSLEIWWSARFIFPDTVQKWLYGASAMAPFETWLYVKEEIFLLIDMIETLQELKHEQQILDPIKENV